MTERENQYYQDVIDYYPIALECVTSKLFNHVVVRIMYKDETQFKLTKDKELVAKFHAIQCIANEDIISIGDKDINYISKTKNIELLNLMIQNGWMSNEYDNLQYFSVNFRHKFNFALKGTLVEHYIKMYNFIQAILIIKGSFDRINSKNHEELVLSQVLIDSLKLWCQAFKSAHPNLEIWKDLSDILLPINPDALPPRIYKKSWKKIKEYGDKNRKEMRNDIVNEFNKKTNEFLREMAREGITEQELRDKQLENRK